MTEEESEEELRPAKTFAVRQTVVMPESLYRGIKKMADDEYKLIGEYIRDVLRDFIDKHENLIECEGKDCEWLVDRRWNYCPNCGEEVPEFEDEDEDEE
jgi:hypothetical protein